MDVVLYLYVCLFVFKGMRESYIFMKLQCILCILYVLYKLCYIMLFGINLHWPFDFGKDILILTKFHQNQFFIYLCGFKHLVLYNLVVCYSWTQI